MAFRQHAHGLGCAVPELQVAAWPLRIGSDMQKTTPENLIRVARENGQQEAAEPLNLGERVRELRTARNWTLEQAAKQAGLARSTLSKIENGQMSPTYDALKNWPSGWKSPCHSFSPRRSANRSMAGCR